MSDVCGGVSLLRQLFHLSTSLKLDSRAAQDGPWIILRNDNAGQIHPREKGGGCPAVLADNAPHGQRVVQCSTSSKFFRCGLPGIYLRSGRTRMRPSCLVLAGAIATFAPIGSAQQVAPYKVLKTARV